jgi:hypothetical protein
MAAAERAADPPKPIRALLRTHLINFSAVDPVADSGQGPALGSDRPNAARMEHLRSDGPAFRGNPIMVRGRLIQETAVSEEGHRRLHRNRFSRAKCRLRRRRRNCSVPKADITF